MLKYVQDKKKSLLHNVYYHSPPIFNVKVEKKTVQTFLRAIIITLLSLSDI